MQKARKNICEETSFANINIEKELRYLINNFIKKCAVRPICVINKLILLIR